jgi:hypothetical protein
LIIYETYEVSNNAVGLLSLVQKIPLAADILVHPLP